MLAALIAIAMTNQRSAPEIDREFRGVWVATVDNIDYPSKPGLPVAQLKSELLAVIEKCADLGINAIVLQVRPSADAFYLSPHEPWSWYLTGQQGKAPADGFDPLRFAIEESHKRGIELHAWCNPYRALHPAQKGPVSSDHFSKTNPSVVEKYGSYLWMNPGEKEVQDRSFAVFMDLVERYDLDGIHIDDYFYPYPVKKAGKNIDFPDSDTYQRYRQAGGQLSKSDWRRSNVDQFIERVFRGIKARKAWVKFGISPFGIYRPGIPKGIKAGIDQRDELYADALRWYQEGWCDYFSPQLYWPIAQTAQAFPTLLNWWADQRTANVHLWPGLYTSRTNPSDGNWNAQEVTDQITLIRKNDVASGEIHFSMKPIMRNYNGIADALDKAYAKPALTPESAWLQVPEPGSLQVILDRKMPPGLHFGTDKPDRVGWFLLQDRRGATKITREPGVVQTQRDENGQIYIRVVNRAGRLGVPQLIEGYRLALESER